MDLSAYLIQSASRVFDWRHLLVLIVGANINETTVIVVKANPIRCTLGGLFQHLQPKLTTIYGTRKRIPADKFAEMR